MTVKVNVHSCYTYYNRLIKNQPVQGFSSHRQQCVVHSDSIVYAVTGLDVQAVHREPDDGARSRSELDVAVQTSP